MPRFLSRRPPLFYLLPLFALLLLGALWALVLARITDEREVATSRALAESQAFVRIYEEHTVRLLRQVDQATQFLKMEFERNDGYVNLESYTKRKGLLPAELAQMIAVVDAEGRVVASTHGLEIDNLRAREYFQAHVEVDKDDLYIGRSTVGRVTGQWSIPLSRRLNHGDGTFAGVIMVSLNPQMLYTDYDAPFLGEHGSVGLLGDDDVFRIRRIGQSTRHAESAEFSAFRRGELDGRQGSFTRESPVDHVSRIYSYRQLQDFPLTAIAGLAEEDAYAEFHHSRANYLWGAGLGSLFIAGFIALLMLQGRALEESRRRAAKAQTIYRAAAEGSLDAFYLLESMRDAQGRITDFRFVEVNRRGAALIGLAPEMIVGKALCELLPVNRSGGFFDKYVRVLESGTPLEEEFGIDTPLVAARWLRHQVVPTGDGIAITSRDISARKRAEAELRNNRKFLQTLIDNLPLMVFAKSTRAQDYGSYVAWNSAAEAITGIPAAAVIGRTGREVFPPDMAQSYEEHDRRMLADPMVRDNPEYESRRADGSMRTLHRITVPIFDDRGQPEYILGVIEDITVRKRQEFLLREQRAEMQAVNDASPLGLFRIDMQGNFTYANRAYERITGLPVEALLGRGWAVSIHPDDRKQVRGASERLARDGNMIDLTHRVTHVDGRVLWAAVKVAPVRVDGAVTGYVGSIDDITERRATMQSQRMLAAIIEASADVVAIAAPDGRVSYLNPAARRLAGLAPEADISGTSVADYYPPRILARMRDQAMPVALKDGLWIGENVVYDSERREVPIKHMIIAHRGADGALEYFSGVMRDISADKAAEQALRDSESRMRTITDTLPAMVSFVGRDERYRFVNRAYEQVFGRPRAAILGLSLRELHGEAAYAQIGQYARRALAGETVVFERDESEAGRVPGGGRDAPEAANAYRCFETTYIPQLRAAEDGSPSRVLGFHVMKQDITARKLEEKRLIQLAHIDSMTGLTNRAGFHLKLAELMAHQDTQAPLLALMYLDIDHFKSVNDTYGHPAGDALLKAFAGRLMRAVRDTDVVARLGGDEFTIILPGLRRPEDATAVAAKIVQAMRPSFALGEQTVQITTSIGLAFHQGAGMSPEALIQRADEMLYQSKAAGRDTYHVAPLLRIQDGIAA